MPGREGCAAGVSVNCNFFNSSCDGLLGSLYCVSCLVNACSTCGGFFFCEIPFVVGWPWVLRLTQAHSCVAFVKRLLLCDIKSDELCGGCPTGDVDTPNLEPCAATCRPIKF